MTVVPWVCELFCFQLFSQNQKGQNLTQDLKRFVGLFLQSGSGNQSPSRATGHQLRWQRVVVHAFHVEKFLFHRRHQLPLRRPDVSTVVRVLDTHVTGTQSGLRYRREFSFCCLNHLAIRSEAWYSQTKAAYEAHLCLQLLSHQWSITSVAWGFCIHLSCLLTRIANNKAYGHVRVFSSLGICHSQTWLKHVYPCFIQAMNSCNQFAQLCSSSFVTWE